MPENLMLFRDHRHLCILTLMALVMAGSAAVAQVGPPPPAPPPPAAPAGPAGNPMCPRLEAQLASIDRGGGDTAKAEQVRRYEEAAAKQQGELDRVTSQAKRQGCDSSGFFSLFSGQSAQCGPINGQIQQMRANLDQITTSLERLRGGSGFGNAERDNQRRSVLQALAQNNCGPQYANAARGSGNFLDNLFGNNNNNNTAAAPAPDLGPQSGTFRTVCARSCDGAYFPISFATVPSRFADDEKTCKNLCPASEATLYTYRNPGEDMNQAVSVSGQPYSAMPNAFRYRQEFVPSCSCKAAGQTWSEALKSIDDKAAAEQQGDIIVTEESAKKMSQPPQQRAAPVAKKKGAAAPATAAGGPAPAPTAEPPPAPAAASSDVTPAKDRPVRSVGPTFIPAR
jgi:hypothetical protein